MRSLAIVLVFWFGSVAMGQWQPNLVENPSAEDDGNRDDQPDGWRGDAFRSPAKLQWDTVVAHTGRASLRISESHNPAGRPWNESTGRWMSSQRIPVTAGQSYTLGAWIKTAGVTGRADARIAWFGNKKWLAESVAPPVQGTSDWQRRTVTVQAPAEAVEAMVYCGLSQSQGTAWFDDVVLVAGTRLPTDFQPVDLAARCNAELEDAFAPLGRGRVQLRGVPFDLAAPQENKRWSCVMLASKAQPDLPREVEIPLERKCECLYFLHACRGDDGGRVAQYELCYADGQSSKAAIRGRREIADRHKPVETKESAVAWETVRGDAGLGVFPLVNPKPEIPVRAVRITSALGKASPMLVALTTADGPAVLAPRPLRYEFTDTTGWYAWNFPLDDENLDTIDLTGLLDAPAGKHGMLTVRPDGHFYFSDGTRARFFGTNICGRWAAPEKEQAPKIAARLAKYGVNLLRIHAIDGQWGPLVDRSAADSRHWDEAALDRIDFFFAELKKRGIYIYFDCLDYRQFKDGDGVKDASLLEHGWKNSIKGASCYNERMIELEKEFVRKFFTHTNPYTKLRYADDPAVAVVEITNENSVFYFQNTELSLPCYREELEARWNAWLAKRYGDRRALAKAWTNDRGQCALLAEEDPAQGTVVLPLKHLYQKPDGVDFVGPRSPVRVDAMTRFLFEIERNYYRQMTEQLRAVGVRVPITGTNQTFCPASVYADAACDFMSRNNYWQHPAVRAKPYFTFRNLAVLNSQLARVDNPITAVASSSVAGKPMIVPEFNFPWPIEFRAECLLLMTAYACLQDWDGLLFFAYDPNQRTLSMFGNQSDPVRWGQYPAAAIMFHRHDVSAARRTVLVNYAEKETFTGGPSHSGREFSPYRDLAYVSKVRNAYPETPAQVGAEVVQGAGYREPGAGNSRATETALKSDTGELSLDSRKGLFTLDTPRSKAVAGFLGQAGQVELTGLKLRSATPFAAVMVTSLDGTPLASTRRMLITAVARAENSGQGFASNKKTVPQPGRLPVLAEPVGGELVLPVAGSVEVYPLDETGKRRTALPAVSGSGILTLKLDAMQSPWCEVVVKPGDR